MATESNYLEKADVWTLLDLIVAEWTTDPTSVQCFDLRIVERAKVLVEARRRQSEVQIKDKAFADFTQAFADYLEAIGWRALVAANPQIRGFETPGVGRYEFALEFTGGRARKAGSLLIMPATSDGDGGH